LRSGWQARVDEETVAIRARRRRASTASRRPMNKLLIVDDSSAMRKIIMRILREAELDVVNLLEAESAAAGLERLALEPDIGLVLSDVNMPRMNGIDFVKAIRLKHSKERLPVILVTNAGAQASMLNGFEHGANGFIAKPFTPASIRTVLEPYVH
jgi:two-component system chemotaxis response regulator CheY